MVYLFYSNIYSGVTSSTVPVNIMNILSTIGLILAIIGFVGNYLEYGDIFPLGITVSMALNLLIFRFLMRRSGMGYNRILYFILLIICTAFFLIMAYQAYSESATMLAILCVAAFILAVFGGGILNILFLRTGGHFLMYYLFLGIFGFIEGVIVSLYAYSKDA